MSNIVAIVGRPNVGKSTFFNRLIGQRKAIMDNESGITRDRHYGHSEWCGKFFTVIDTGGYVTNSDDVFEESIRNQVDLAIDEADVILFLVDVDYGLTDLDKEFANVLRRGKKPTYLVANKADNNNRVHMATEFYSLGMGDIYPISAQSGSGTGDLLDKVVSHFEEDGDEDPDAGIPRISILGRPNAGKSSFVNALLGKERSIVTDVAGTTRDSVNTKYNLFNKEFILVDTAGIRKKSKVTEDVEFYSVLRAIRSLEESDVVILMIDATRGLEAQDLNILSLAQKNYKGVVILINKWDLIEKDHKTSIEFEKEIKHKIAPNSHIPIIFTSATTKQRIMKAIETAVDVYNSKNLTITTSALNDALLPEIERYPPPALKGKYIRIKYVTQIASQVPTFAFFCNLPQYIKDPYKRYLENKLRYHFGFEGVPIRLFFRKK